MGQSTKTAIGLLVVLLIVWGIYGLSQKGDEAPAKDTSPISIGFIGPLTGDAASIGTGARAAAELAVAEVNAAGGINGRELKLIVEDGQCNAKEAVNAANKLINVDKVPVIIGGTCSTETSAFAPAAMQSKTIVFSYCSSAPSLSQTGAYFFRSYPSDSFQGKFAAEYLYNTVGVKKVVIAYHVSEWGTGLKDVFTSTFTTLGGEVVAAEGAPQDARDYRSMITKIKGLDAEYVYAPMYPEGGIAFLDQAKELGLTKKVFGGDAWDDPKLLESTKGKVDIMYVVPKTPELAQDWKAQLLAKTGGEQVSICAPQAYDNVKIVAEVLKAVEMDPDKLSAGLRSMSYPGISGRIAFDANGDLTVAEYVVKKSENGLGVVVE